MSTNDPGNLTQGIDGTQQAGDAVMHAIGKLDEAASQLDMPGTADEVEPEAVAKWITVIGKAILAIFKP